MKLGKKLLSVILAISFLCVIPLAMPAEAAAKEIPLIHIGGGFHRLYLNEYTPEWEYVLNPENFEAFLLSRVDDLIDALKSLNMDKAVDIVRDSLWEMFDPIRMENGVSVQEGITGYSDTYHEYNLYYSNNPVCELDWRLSPADNAAELNKFITTLKEVRGIDEVYIKGMSSSGAIALAYLQEYGSDDVAGLILENSMHEGSSFYGGIAKREIAIDAEALGKTTFFWLGGVAMDFSPYQPMLRNLYESGLFDIAATVLSFMSPRIIGRIYDEVLIPLLFEMPIFWSYVPAKDYEAAKAALLKGDEEKYGNLIAMMDDYFYNVAAGFNNTLLELSEKENFKLAIAAGYGLSIIPIVKGASVHSDNMLDTVYASIGASCASPLGSQFPFWYSQAGDGCHDHISPDRMIDASTCLFPDNTWFFYNSPHGPHPHYYEWFEWFRTTDNPTIFTDARYPQFMEDLGGSKIVPLTRVAEPFSFNYVIKLIGEFLLRLWRLILMIPFELIKENIA